MMELLFILGIICGVMLFTQTTINSQLKVHLNSSYVSTLINFFIGTCLLFILTIAIEGAILPDASKLLAMEWWSYLGGALGIVVVLSAILVFPRIGGVQTVAIPLFGQVIMSLIIDNFGLFGMNKESLNFLNIIGIVVLIIGIVLTVILPDYMERKNNAVLPVFMERNNNPQKESLKNEGSLKGAKKLFWQIIALISGFALASQVAINGHLGVGVESTVQASLISFFIGTSLLLIINMIVGDISNIKFVFERKAPWWFYIGGILGGLYVFSSVILTPQIGAGAFVICVLIGQMIISLIIDNYGLLRSKLRKVSSIQIIGFAVILFGAIMIKLL